MAMRSLFLERNVTTDLCKQSIFYMNFRRFGIFLDDPLMSLHKFLANKCNKVIGKSLFKSYNGKFLVFFLGIIISLISFFLQNFYYYDAIIFYFVTFSLIFLKNFVWRIN